MAPAGLARLAKMPGGEESQRGSDVVIAADGSDEAQQLSGARLAGGDHRRPAHVGDGDQADGGRLGAAGQVLDRIGDGGDVAGRHTQPPQVGDLRHQDGEAAGGQGAREGDEAPVVLAGLDRAGDENQRRQRWILG